MIENEYIFSRLILDMINKKTSTLITSHTFYILQMAAFSHFVSNFSTHSINIWCISTTTTKSQSFFFCYSFQPFYSDASLFFCSAHCSIHFHYVYKLLLCQMSDATLPFFPLFSKYTDFFLIKSTTATGMVCMQFCPTHSRHLRLLQNVRQISAYPSP